MGILAFLGLKKYDASVYALYGKAVEQGRVPRFYTELGVPDTPNGRFDLIALHVYIVMRRLKDLKDDGSKLSQDLFDVMFADMDKNMREMGVGDLSVGKKVKGLAKAFYGRVKAYDEALAGEEGASLDEALNRNLYLDAEPSEQQIKAMSAYLVKEIEASGDWSFADISGSQFNFGQAPELEALSSWKNN